MRPMYDPEVDVFRSQVQSFLAENLPADWQGIGVLPAEEAHAWVMEWRKILHRERYLAPGWPAEYGGGGMSALEQVILAEEFAKAGVPTGGPNDGFGITMLGNTLLTWGTEEQKKYYLPRILSNEDVWCQGYSEPNAGSDLGSLGLKATLDGDQWILNGQKIWTSAGHLADHIFTLARTDPDSPKHKGISFLLPVLKFAKIGPLLSMGASMGAYGWLFGWKFGVGMVSLIFIHELGHGLVMRVLGVPAGPMTFIPFFGAVIEMKGRPVSSYHDALIALGGPVLGTLGTAPFLLYGISSGSQFALAPPPYFCLQAEHTYMKAVECTQLCMECARLSRLVAALWC
jgi:hypothetical protein